MKYWIMYKILPNHHVLMYLGKVANITVAQYKDNHQVKAEERHVPRPLLW